MAGCLSHACIIIAALQVQHQAVGAAMSCCCRACEEILPLPFPVHDVQLKPVTLVTWAICAEGDAVRAHSGSAELLRLLDEGCQQLQVAQQIQKPQSCEAWPM